MVEVEFDDKKLYSGVIIDAGTVPQSWEIYFPEDNTTETNVLESEMQLCTKRRVYYVLIDLIF